jgi:recombination protein RecT
MSENNIKKYDEKQIQTSVLRKKEVLESRLKLNGISRNWQDFANDITHAFSQNEDLHKCDLNSVIDAGCQLAKAGLYIGGNISHLIPYGKKCQFQIGYEGYGILLNRVSSGIKYQEYQVIYEGDIFEETHSKESGFVNGQLVKKGGFTFKHGKDRDLFFNNKEKIKGAYAFILLNNGDYSYQKFSKEELDKYFKEWNKAQNKFVLKTNTFHSYWSDHMYSKQAFKIVAKSMTKKYPAPQEIKEIINEEDNNDMVKDVTPEEKPTPKTLNDILSNDNETIKFEVEETIEKEEPIVDLFSNKKIDDII